ncbi:Transient receptor putative cation channel sub M member 2 [Saguinus oedipus]|uniref:Transient receptor putative cation channel sub M member 2 n=1 Tax=Saguinus oedipus TaxID=9490 RepID=A0ABQ9TY90_SAGOE|nr:Transient receptor putative cation channel sub M member 2 [Saguinus oedipus]
MSEGVPVSSLCGAGPAPPQWLHLGLPGCAVLASPVAGPGSLTAFAPKVRLSEGHGGSRAGQGLWRSGHRPSQSPSLLHREKRLREVSSPAARTRAFFTAPVVVFLLNILSYFAFLCLFAYVLMVDFQPMPSWCECAIYLWLFSLVCEEMRQVQPHPLSCAPAWGHPLGQVLTGDPGPRVYSA